MYPNLDPVNTSQMVFKKSVPPSEAYCIPYIEWRLLFYNCAKVSQSQVLNLISTIMNVFSL